MGKNEKNLILENPKIITLSAVILAGFVSSLLRISNYYIFIMLILSSFLSIYNVFNTEKRCKNSIQALICIIISVFFAFHMNNIPYMSHNSWVNITKYIEMLVVVLIFVMALFNYDGTSREGPVIQEIGKGIIFCVINASLSVFLMEIVFNSTPQSIPFSYIAASIGVLFLFYIAFTLLIGSYRIAGMFGLLLFTLFGIVNHFVYVFRGIPIVYYDLASAGTALNVASGFKYEFTGECIIAIVLTVFFLIFYIRSLKWNVPGDKKGWRRLILLRGMCIIISLACIGGSYFVAQNQQVLEKHGIYANAWAPIETYKQFGTTFTFLAFWQLSMLERPETYTVESVNGIYDSLTEKVNAEAEVGVTEQTALVTTPKNIIVIMNEAFSDISVLGNVQTNKDYMPYYDSMCENIIKGETLVPAYGGGTCNSEYEFLTGNSIWFTPNSYPYMALLSEPQPSLVTTLKSQGYYSLAIHPATEKNWNRDRNYKYMEFDDFWSLEDLEEDERLQNIRLYTSDSSLYNVIIDTVEEHEEPIFIFSVTMQNHGGYDFEDYEADVDLKNVDSDYMDQYLSLILESDRALEGLIEYFKTDDEPTMIVMFGDHQPTIPIDIRSSLMGKNEYELTNIDMELLYQTPYLIWTNYDTESELDALASTNYLSTIMLERAGLDMPAYNQFLLEMQEEIPAMNTWGFYDSNYNFHYYESEEAEYMPYFEDYRNLMYNQLMDKKRMSGAIFYLQSE